MSRKTLHNHIFAERMEMYKYESVFTYELLDDFDIEDLGVLVKKKLVELLKHQNVGFHHWSSANDFNRQIIDPRKVSSGRLMQVLNGALSPETPDEAEYLLMRRKGTVKVRYFVIAPRPL